MDAARRDYYEVLGVARDANQKTIKDTFRQLAMKYHPDRNKSPDAEERFKEIAEAYAVLSDPKKRSQYDNQGFAGVAGFSQEDLFSGINFEDIFKDMGFGFGFGAAGRGGGLFDSLFRGQRHTGPARGQDIEVRLVVPLERIAQGGEESVRFSRPIVCPVCHGSGAKPGTSPRKCNTCGGSGQKVISRQENQEKGSVRFQQITICPECHGQGTFIDEPCKECGGHGKVEKSESLKVSIPAGIDEGTALRIPGHGLPSSKTGGATGDLYVIVHSALDPRFKRVGADLWCSETIEVVDAVLGTQIQIPTLEGELKVTVPAGTQPEGVLRLRNKGLPYSNGRGRGDLNIIINVRIPEKLSTEEQELYQRLQSIKGKGTRKRFWSQKK
ncbi:MAG: molecular chaperone DnaJ [Gammaproteobacteria bacterium]|nr:molecular chaperone DnaJ [Gammaproteobacteria bacterium]